MGDGNGWVFCALGHRHWGRFGAAGLLVRDDDRVILQHRAPWTHEGDTWGLPGGARDSHEDVVQAALREAAEEASIVAAAVAPYGLLVDDHGGWSYTTVLARPRERIAPHAANAESSEVRWWDDTPVAGLPLHRGFSATWPLARPAVQPVTIVVDAANVVGSRPDGWWRDRAAATQRLLDGLRRLIRSGIRADQLPSQVSAAQLSAVVPRISVVVEGRAAAIVDEKGVSAAWWDALLDIHAALRDGDSEVVRQAAISRTAGTQPVVVTADRQLRDRLPTQATTVGPSWLLNLIDHGASTQ